MRDSEVLESNPHISRSALEAIHDQVFGWALSRCDYDRTIAEDLVQQTYVELLTGKAKFEGRSSLKTFVFAVVQNLAKGRYRRLASRLRVLKELARETTDEPAAAIALVEAPTIWRVVQDLPQRQRDVIELVFCRDMSVEAASRVMGVTVGTARVHYDRAKKALRTRLENDREFNRESR